MLEQFSDIRSTLLNGFTSAFLNLISRTIASILTWNSRLPSKLSFAEGALLEPLSVVLHGIRTAGLNLGHGTVICGAGPIGLIALAAARASGAHPIVITDIEPRRLQFAREFVPLCRTYRVDGRRIRRLFRNDDDDSLQDLEHDLTQEYYAPRTVLECTGVESSVCTAAYTVRRGGTICIIGVGKSVMNNLPFMHISLAEVCKTSTRYQCHVDFSLYTNNRDGKIELKFINRYRDTWPAGIACLSGGILDLKPLVTHVYPLEDAVNALHLAADPKNGSIKIQIVDEVEEHALP
jgi:L-iditol 2-dehydrogenase